MLKAYKYRIYPDKDQEEFIKINFGACRFVYNWALEHKIKTYEQTKKSISRFDLQHILVHELKPSNKTILRIGRFEPSSKICNVCGYHNGNLTLNSRFKDRVKTISSNSTSTNFT